MAKAKVIFHKLIQGSQDYGSDDQHMVSREFFTVEIEGKISKEAYADIKQPVGSDFETTPLEISKPVCYNALFNYETFREAAEGYYRSLVGSQGSGIHIAGGSNIRMQNNTFIQQEVAELVVKI